MPTTTRCSGNGVQTCGSDGQWGAALACAATTPNCSSGQCGQPPSCQVGAPGTTNCGSGNASCCESLEVEGGTYYRTYDLLADGGVSVAADGGATGEADPATVSSFRLDKYVVTVGRFRPFVYAWGSGWTPTAGSGKHSHLNGGQGLVNAAIAAGTSYEAGWVDSDDSNLMLDSKVLQCDPNYATWTPMSGANENLPMNCVNAYEARAFCIWDGGFLPSEAELEYAAAAGSQQREYPWGSTDPGVSTQYAVYNCDYGACTDAQNSLAPVGHATLGAGLWGQLDLAGEVSAWTLDWYYDTYVDPCVDCAYLLPTANGTLRGGNFYYPKAALLPPNRGYGVPTDRIYGVGLRCARSP